MAGPDIMNFAARYAAALGRPPFIEKKSSGGIEIAAYGFPPMRRSFWRSLFSEAHDATVYLTAGMSAYPMATPLAEQQTTPPRVELFTPPEGADEKRLCGCTKALAMLNVVPITRPIPIQAVTL
jgi:hypothetical protein